MAQRFGCYGRNYLSHRLVTDFDRPGRGRPVLCHLWLRNDAGEREGDDACSLPFGPLGPPRTPVLEPHDAGCLHLASEREPSSPISALLVARERAACVGTG